MPERRGPSKDDATVGALDEMLERISNLLSTERRKLAFAHDLKEVQLRVLIYLSRCNRFSDTPQAVTEFLGLTKGTVSQTIGSLANKGLIKKVADEVDARSVHLKLTRPGSTLLSKFVPLQLLSDTGASMKEGERERLTEALRALLLGLQRTAGTATFGACHSCRHLQSKSGRFHCGLTHEPLMKAETLLLCREHDSV